MSALISSAPALTLSKEDEAARDVALQWLQVVDSGNYKDAALMMSETVRASRDWSNYLTAQRAALGRANKRQAIEVKHASTVPGAADIRNYDIIRFKTSFEVRAGLAPNYGVASRTVAIEEVVLAKMGCCWEMMSYEIKEN